MVKRLGNMWRGQAGSASAARAGAMAEDHEALLLLRDFEESGQGWFWSTDATGAVTYISASVAAAMDREHADLLGNPFHTLFTLDRDEAEDSARTLPLIFSANKSFSELPVRATRGKAEIAWTITAQ